MVEGLPHVPLFEDSFSVIGWTENPHVTSACTVAQYLALKHVSTSIGPLTPPHIEQESLDRYDIEREIAVYAPNFTSVAEVVVGTNYIATVHTRSAEILSQRMPLRASCRRRWRSRRSQSALQWNPAMESDPGVGVGEELSARERAAARAAASRQRDRPPPTGRTRSPASRRRLRQPREAIRQSIPQGCRAERANSTSTWQGIDARDVTPTPNII